MDEYDDKDAVLACPSREFDFSTKKKLTVSGRDIVIIKTHGKFYALDARCYHAEGPLADGDIEDFHGRTCMVCPWHRYKVCVDTGQNFYQSVDPHNMSKPPVWTAGKVHQRTHRVVVKDDNVYVVLSQRDGTLQSDQYNS